VTPLAANLEGTAIAMAVKMAAARRRWSTGAVTLFELKCKEATNGSRCAANQWRH
jgi:hypothetical protein